MALERNDDLTDTPETTVQYYTPEALEAMTARFDARILSATDTADQDLPDDERDWDISPALNVRR